MAFRDLDNAFQDCLTEVQQPETKNFAVLFDAEVAKCSVNQTADTVSASLRDRGGDKKPCLWLNLWGWGAEHQAIIDIVASHYDISPRLKHTLCPQASHVTHTKADLSSQDDLSSNQTIDQLEMTNNQTHLGVSRQQALSLKRRLPTSIADIADDLWHFCTVDSARRYLCICWNALFFPPDTGKERQDGKPSAVRIWSSLVLCDDGTVISTFESPPTASWEALKTIRSNQLNILMHLSVHGGLRSSQNALMQIAVRPFHSSTGATDVADMASLLFYYLFDDWLNIYQQAVGADNPYRSSLQILRRRMILSAEVDQVTNLHRLGRELSILRAVYRSYQSIIERIVQRQRGLCQSCNYTHSGIGRYVGKGITPSSADHANLAEATESTIQISQSATARFERLHDRIASCALTEVDECIKEKDDLVLMNFNLVSLKVSQAVEKLTRITILLAKVTILFLPASLTTAYFSMQLDQISKLYSLKTYWVSFTVVVLTTILVLLAFGYLSDRYEGKIVYKSLVKTFVGRRKRSRQWDA